MSQKKIALVGYRLNKGGAERVMANLSNFLYQKGLEVHIIIVLDDIEYPYSGTVLNLGLLKNDSNTMSNKLKRFYYLNKYMRQHQFDFVIDFRFRSKLIQEFLITKLIFKTKSIYTVHHSKIHEYMPKSPFLTRLLYGNSLAVISISKAMERNIVERHKLKNVINIYNPIDIDHIQKSITDEIDLKFEYVIGVGHYDTNLKQFDKLIEAYSNSNLPDNDVHLVILGTGKLKSYLVGIAREHKVEHLVHFLGFQSNPFKYMRRAKYFVLSSEIEGFPMVVLEALACGTPVIAFDCPTGPSEIVIDRENGLLIENQNLEALIDGMNTFIQDVTLYNKCKDHALKSVEKYSVEVIGNQWLKLLDINS